MADKSEFDGADRRPTPAHWQSQTEHRERVEALHREAEICALHDTLSRLTGTAPPVSELEAGLEAENTALADIRDIARSYRALSQGDTAARTVATGSSARLPTAGGILIPCLSSFGETATSTSRVRLRLLALTSAVCAAVGATIVALSAALT